MYINPFLLIPILLFALVGLASVYFAIAAMWTVEEMKKKEKQS